jgi:hypothetical protein
MFGYFKITSYIWISRLCSDFPWYLLGFEFFEFKNNQNHKLEEQPVLVLCHLSVQNVKIYVFLAWIKE